MAGDLQRDGVKFCRSIFDTVRKMSADGLGVTRQGYSTTETEVLDYLKMIGQELGLEINTDLAGNVWMCLPGKNRDLPAFVAGSHADSVPQGGNYDGLAGITAALAVAWWMRRTGFVPERDYMILMMRCEESSFFGKAYVGSLALTGQAHACRYGSQAPHTAHDTRRMHLGLRFRTGRHHGGSSFGRA